jgi:hypothetical protein
LLGYLARCRDSREHHEKTESRGFAWQSRLMRDPLSSPLSRNLLVGFSLPMPKASWLPSSRTPSISIRAPTFTSFPSASISLLTLWHHDLSARLELPWSRLKHVPFQSSKLSSASCTLRLIARLMGVYRPNSSEWQAYGRGRLRSEHLGGGQDRAGLNEVRGSRHCPLRKRTEVASLYRQIKIA